MFIYYKPIPSLTPVMLLAATYIHSETIQERALRFMLKDQISTYEQLQEKCNYATLHIRRLRIISTDVFKSLNNLNPSFMERDVQC